MAASLTKQTITLTLANAYTRGLGFLLRLALARIMGAEALGMMELTSSVSMLALTPVTAGTPVAVSRMTARHPSCDQRQVLLAGRSLALRMAAVLAPALAMLAPLLAYLLGDTRTLPGLWCTVPAIPLMGLCSVYCGWYYGREDTRRPALSEATEQTVRCVLALGLLTAFSGASLGIRAAIPPAAESVAALCAVLMMRHASGLTRMRQEPSPTLRRELFRLCAPSVFARLCVTAARALNAVVLPVCLRASGLSTQAATAQFGSAERNGYAAFDDAVGVHGSAGHGGFSGGRHAGRERLSAAQDRPPCAFVGRSRGHGLRGGAVRGRTMDRRVAVSSGRPCGASADHGAHDGVLCAASGDMRNAGRDGNAAPSPYGNDSLFLRYADFDGVVGGDSASAAVWRGAGDDGGAVHQSVLGADAAPAPRAGKREKLHC